MAHSARLSKTLARALHKHVHQPPCGSHRNTPGPTGQVAPRPRAEERARATRRQVSALRCGEGGTHGASAGSFTQAPALPPRCWRASGGPPGGRQAKRASALPAKIRPGGGGAQPPGPTSPPRHTRGNHNTELQTGPRPPALAAHRHPTTRGHTWGANFHCPPRANASARASGVPRRLWPPQPFDGMQGGTVWRRNLPEPMSRPNVAFGQGAHGDP